MRPYLDLAAVLSLVMPGARALHQELNTLDPPFALNSVHVLQVENGLCRGRFQARQLTTANNSLRQWRQQWVEGVFVLEHVDLAAGFEQARRWNAQSQLQPPRWGLLLHPSLAAIAGATHFISLDVGNRRLARDAGLKVLPQSL